MSQRIPLADRAMDEKSEWEVSDGVQVKERLNEFQFMNLFGWLDHCDALFFAWTFIVA